MIAQDVSQVASLHRLGHALVVLEMQAALARIGIEAAVPDKVQDVERLVRRPAPQRVKRPALEPLQHNQPAALKLGQRHPQPVPLALRVQPLQVLRTCDHHQDAQRQMHLQRRHPLRHVQVPHHRRHRRGGQKMILLAVVQKLPGQLCQRRRVAQPQPQPQPSVGQARRVRTRSQPAQQLTLKHRVEQLAAKLLCRRHVRRVGAAHPA